MIILLLSCKSDTRKESNVGTSLKDVSELTYLEVYMLAFEEGSGGGMDFHGESFGLEAHSQLEMIDGAPCVSRDCGRVKMLRNKNLERDLEVAVRAYFQLPNNPTTEIFRFYLVPADSAVSVGCSHICYGGQSYPIQREINSAGYKVQGELSN